MERLMLWRTCKNKNTTKLSHDEDVNDDLSSWEIINSSHEDEQNGHKTLSSSDDERPGFVEKDNHIDEIKRPGFNQHEVGLGNTMVVPVLFVTKPDDPILIDPRWGDVGDSFPDDDQVRQRLGLDKYEGQLRSDDDDDDVEYDYDYDYDNGYANQRMGKVGKKVNNGMMKKSKRLPRYYYNKMA